MALIGVALLVLKCFVVFLFDLGLFACFCERGSQRAHMKLQVQVQEEREGSKAHEPRQTPPPGHHFSLHFPPHT